MDIDHDLGKIYNNLTNIDPGSSKLVISGTTGVQLPEGTTDQRPAPTEGVIRRNIDTGYVEVYSNSQWIDIRDYSLSGLPIGGNASDILIKNSATNYDAYWGPITADMAPYAKQLVTYVRNDSGTTLPKGTPVYQIGTVGNSWTISVGAADAADSTKMPAIGILAQDLEPSIAGDMIVLGEIRDVNTSTFNESDLVYVSPGGGYTNIKPTSLNVAIQFLGIVTKIHETNGGGYITGTGTVDVFRGDLPGGNYEWSGTSWDLIPDSISNLKDTQIASLQSGQYLRYNGTKWVNNTSTTLAEYGITDAVNKAGDSMTGSLSLPKTKGEGLLIDNGYSWIDIIGDVTPKTIGTNAASLKTYIGAIRSWVHPVGSYGDIVYHIPHEYAPNTNIFIHVHWGHNGTNISGTFKMNIWATFAKRDGTYSSTIATSITVNSLNITNTPQYFKRVDEIQFSMSGGSSSMLNTTDIEVDGLINVHYELDTIPSITGSTYSNLPYIHTIDVHMQSNVVGTKNKDPDFYI